MDSGVLKVLPHAAFSEEGFIQAKENFDIFADLYKNIKHDLNRTSRYNCHEVTGMFNMIQLVCFPSSLGSLRFRGFLAHDRHEPDKAQGTTFENY